MSPRRDWNVYMIRCTDGSLYTGIATDVQRRFREHRSGGVRAAKYFRGHHPEGIVFSRKVGSRRSALMVEAKIKKASKQVKEAFIADPPLIDPWMPTGCKG